METSGILEAISAASEKTIILMDAHSTSANQHLRDLHDQQDTIIKEAQERLKKIWDDIV
jgi:cellobiose-specific phosphotransferase system component IIA